MSVKNINSPYLLTLPHMYLPHCSQSNIFILTAGQGLGMLCKTHFLRQTLKDIHFNMLLISWKKVTPQKLTSV
jgi:hypothetical protein